MSLFLAFLLGFCFLCDISFSWGSVDYIEGPKSPSDWNSCISQITDQRTTTLQNINYNGSIFSVPALLWTQNDFISPQSHPYDLYFYDPVNHKYTMDKFTNDLNSRYGGIDSVLVWPTYTNIGADDRNQYDLIYSLPGHIDGISNFVQN